MNLRQRFAELLAVITKDIPEREYYVQLGFLTALIQEPFYLYGRPGCGSSLFIRRISSAFKDAKILKLGKKNKQLPDNINDFNLIIFDNFTPTDEQSKSNLQIVIHDHDENSIIISGNQKPESALSRSEVSDQVTLTIMLPDNISSDALCKLLQIHGTDSNVTVPPEIAISAEEQAQWIQQISKVTLSANTLAVIGKVAETCENNSVYVPIRRWLALSNMIKAIAFLNGRTETKLIDTFFLGTSIWGRSASNTAISERYREILKAQLYKNTPSLLETPYDANDLLMRVNHLVHSSNNLYETKPFNGEKCLAYRITIAGESVPLYAPLKYIETDRDFNPYNELRQVEKRVVCNYHGTSNCTISIDPQVRTSGLRSSVNQANTNCTKFEEFGTLTTYILRENAPEIIEEKKNLRDSLNTEIKESMERETANLVALRNTYKLFNESKDDLFCFTQMFNAVQDDIKKQFDNTANIIKTIKKASEVIASFSNNMLKTPNLVGKPQNKTQSKPQATPSQQTAEKPQASTEK